MKDDTPSETQQELFTEFSSAPKRPERFPTLAKTQKPILISTTLEQLLMVSIIFILFLCAVFFLGVLRGKSLGRVLPPPRAAGVPMSKPAPTAEPVAALPAATAAVPAPPAVSTGKPYTIQLVTYRKKEYAEAELNTVRKMGFSGFVAQKGEYFLVYVGQYASKEEAKKDLGVFHAKYKDSFLTRRA